MNIIFKPADSTKKCGHFQVLDIWQKMECVLVHDVVLYPQAQQSPCPIVGTQEMPVAAGGQ